MMAINMLMGKEKNLMGLTPGQETTDSWWLLRVGVFAVPRNRSAKWSHITTWSALKSYTWTTKMYSSGCMYIYICNGSKSGRGYQFEWGREGTYKVLKWCNHILILIFHKNIRNKFHSKLHRNLYSRAKNSHVYWNIINLETKIMVDFWPYYII